MGGKKFSECKNMEAYFPTIKVKGYPFPLIACNLDKCDTEHLSWTGDHHAHCWMMLRQISGRWP